MADLYVSTTGNDSNEGSIFNPWLTWDKAFHTADVGDTVYFRGGVYSQAINTDGAGIRYTSSYGEGNSGTLGNEIIYTNYPGEIPILDCSNVVAVNYDYHCAIWIQNIDYIKIQGLHIRNVLEIDSNTICEALVITTRCENIILDRMVIYNIGGVGFRISQSHNITLLNCDAYNCCDAIHFPQPGNYGSGFGISSETKYPDYVLLDGCRAWACSDQGFGNSSEGITEMNKCWSFNNIGLYTGEGHGFKLGWMYHLEDAPFDHLTRIVTNCIAAYNTGTGFETNDTSHPGTGYDFFNNLAYHNGYGGFPALGMGFRILNPSDNDLLRVLRNNIAYDNEYYDLWLADGSDYTHSNNSWDLAITVNDSDFVSLDYTQLYKVRKSDGSLPDISFGKLRPGTDCRNAGINVSLALDGRGRPWNNPPSIGAFEYWEGDSITTVPRPGIHKYSII